MSEEFRLTLVAIDDEPDYLRLLERTLASPELEVLTATDPAVGLELVLRRRPQVVLLDLRMPGMTGMEVLERIVAADPAIEVILLTGSESTDAAVEAILKGASDYLTKPVSMERLRARVEALLAQARERFRAAQLDREMLKSYNFEGMIGRSPLLLDVGARIRRVAPHFRTALVTGPTGTGKELVARALHNLSPVANGPFVVCNCSAVVETLFESELFGYVKGAFTGATTDKMGMVEAAQGGTLFLDEIAETPPGTQAKLLRLLQQREIQRVGSTQVRRVDVRVVAATNRRLGAMVAERRFRDDLYYRLATVEITLPPLVERKEDLPLLQRHFLEKFSREFGKPVRGLTRRGQALLARYEWPGNVRELENVLSNACLMATGELVDVEDLPERLRSPRGVAGASESDVLIPLHEAERRHALRVLERVGGNKVQAAEILGISRATLYRLLAAAPSAEPAQK
jgi:DNA-binding NtrC family response regulator